MTRYKQEKHVVPFYFLRPWFSKYVLPVFIKTTYSLACENRRISRLLLCAAEKYRRGASSRKIPGVGLATAPPI